MSSIDDKISAAVTFLFCIRNIKLITANLEAGFPKGLLNLLVSGHRSWNLNHFDRICDYLELEPDELLRVGRLLVSLPSDPPGMPVPSGLKAGSLERFTLVYGGGTAGTLAGQVYTASKIWELLPGVARGYGRGRLTDAQIYAAAKSFVARMSREPGASAWRVFGLLEEGDGR